MKQNRNRSVRVCRASWVIFGQVPKSVNQEKLEKDPECTLSQCWELKNRCKNNFMVLKKMLQMVVLTSSPSIVLGSQVRGTPPGITVTDKTLDTTTPVVNISQKVMVITNPCHLA